MSEWISVKKETPEFHKDVLCRVIVAKSGGLYFAKYMILHITNTESGSWNCDGVIVTHWQPLPEPPKGGLND